MQPVETALDAALLVIRSGGSTVAAERSFRKILTGYKEEVLVIWRMDFIVALTTADGQSSPLVRSVGPIGINLARAAGVAAVSDRVARGEVAIAALEAEVVRINNLPSPYNLPLTILAAACTAATFSQIPGGDWGGFAIAFVAGAVGQSLRSLLQARKFPVAPVTLISAVLSACIASIGLRLGFSQTVQATLIASVIYLAPGLPLINGFIDVASHKYLLMGMERIANAVFLFFVIAIAVALAYTIFVQGARS